MHHNRHQRALAVVAGATLGAAGLVGLVGPQADAAGNTFVVGNPATCANADYRTINEAVDVATSGDTISVCAGSYGEQVVVDKPGLTFTGATAGKDPRKKLPRAQTIISNPGGDFVLQGNADDTTIQGFTLTGASNVAAAGVLAFHGSSGLTLTENLIQNNGNGINMQNPDGSMPATITRNNFVNNSANYQSANDNNGTGIFISNGPADNTQITQNAFSQHFETAINFAGDANNPSTGLVVSNNKSTNDATFVVATNSTSAVVNNNAITTDSAKVPGGEHGTGILDFGANTNLRITANTMKATGTTQSSGINLRDFTGANEPSSGTTVSNNTVSGWLNDLRIDDGSQAVVASLNKLSKAISDGILVGSTVSGAVLSRNKVTASGTYACEDQSTGSGTAGTANSWTRNTGGGDPSSPAAICS